MHCKYWNGGELYNLYDKIKKFKNHCSSALHEWQSFKHVEKKSHEEIPDEEQTEKYSNYQQNISVYC